MFSPTRRFRSCEFSAISLDSVEPTGPPLECSCEREEEMNVFVNLYVRDSRSHCTCRRDTHPFTGRSIHPTVLKGRRHTLCMPGKRSLLLLLIRVLLTGRACVAEVGKASPRVVRNSTGGLTHRPRSYRRRLNPGQRYHRFFPEPRMVTKNHNLAVCSPLPVPIFPNERTFQFRFSLPVFQHTLSIS